MSIPKTGRLFLDLPGRALCVMAASIILRSGVPRDAMAASVVLVAVAVILIFTDIF